MKKIFDVLVLTLALNFIAVLAGTGVLMSKAHMDKDKFAKVKEVLFSTSQPTTQGVDLASTEPVASTEPADRLADLLAKASGRPALEQIDFIRQAFDGEMAELDRRRRELLDLQHQIDLARTHAKADREKLEEAQNDLQNRQKLQAKLASDEGFQKALELYNVMPAKQVKTIFMALPDDVVQQYLQAMEPRTSAKIIKEFKLPEETARIQKVLEKIRTADSDSAPGTPLAPAPTGPQAAAPTQ
jgi:flagellar motility protein MotE (MotC chaperone)